ncbi:hypothetical protein TIFTF001_027717 [Ficus carica]|uniref:Cytochrome P450 n=1 Tax=Ficus carica TaxID=3494 RepID=A0AA88DNG3_FICCA|nr:hypothetical protein TIFTF001_027717 [Ficus carica]
MVNGRAHEKSESNGKGPEGDRKSGRKKAPDRYERYRSDGLLKMCHQIKLYDVPAKTRLFINAWAIQRDPSTWERPEEFFSERLENNRVDFKGYDFELVPFGVGRRGCPGLAFGVASIEYITANVLYWFDWKLPSDGELHGDLDMSEYYGGLSS